MRTARLAFLEDDLVPLERPITAAGLAATLGDEEAQRLIQEAKRAADRRPPAD